MSGSGAAFGPSGPPPTAGPPFAVAGPSSLALDGSRAGTASFTVSNITGRPVRARVLAQPGAGADAAWFAVVGESERSLPVAGTATFDVTVSPGPKAAPGPYTFALDAALEDAPDQTVSSPTVAFEVKPGAKKRFPWWIVIVAVVAVIALGVGGWLIYSLTRPHDPVLQQSPAILGTVAVGETLTVQPAVWDQTGLTTTYAWQRCPVTPTTATDGGCTSIATAAEMGTMPATDSYVVSTDDVGMRLRVVEIAALVPSGASSGQQVDSFPHATAASPTTDAVPTPPPVTVTVPDVRNVPLSQAQTDVQDAQLTIVVLNSATTGTTCDPLVADQSPAGDTQAPKGSQVVVTTDRVPLTCLVFIFDPNLIQLPDLIKNGQ